MRQQRIIDAFTANFPPITNDMRICQKLPRSTCNGVDPKHSLHFVEFFEIACRQINLRHAGTRSLSLDELIAANSTV